MPLRPARPRDLLDLLGRQRAQFLAVEFPDVHEDDPADRKVDAHADRVRRNQDFAFAARKGAVLHPPYLGREVSVDHAVFYAAVLKEFRELQHALFGKRDQRVAFFGLLQSVGLRQDFKRRIAPVLENLAAVAAAADHFDDESFAFMAPQTWISPHRSPSSARVQACPRWESAIIWISSITATS
jgi:hypothetical protein